MPYPESRIQDALTPTVYLPEIKVIGKNLFSGPASNDDDDIYYISEPTILNPNSFFAKASTAFLSPIF